MKNIDDIKDKKELLDYVFLAELICTEDEREKLSNIRQALGKAQQLGVKERFKEMLYSLQQDTKTESENALELERDKYGAVKKTIDNFMAIFNSDKKFSTLRLNDFSGRVEIDGKVMNDAGRSKLIYHIEKNYGIKSEKDFDHAVKIFTEERRYNPVREKISSLKWDGKKRIEKLLHTVMDAEDSDYTDECSRLIFHCGVARIFSPGCKVDDVIVLQGLQGNGKSTLVSWLALNEDWYGRVNDIRGNVGIEQIQGKWICEISELLAVSGKERQEEAKQYLDRKSDNYRRPYAQLPEEIPRKCIFIGTTNFRTPFSDKTGNRRYYPVWCNIKPGELYKKEKKVRHYIEQCWAEAYALWQRGEIRHCMRSEMYATVKQMQKNALEDDWRIGAIESFLEKKSETCVLEIWAEALGMFDKPNKSQSRELGIILDNLEGWERGEGNKIMEKYKKQRFWKRKEGARLEPLFGDYCEIVDD